MSVNLVVVGQEAREFCRKPIRWSDFQTTDLTGKILTTTVSADTWQIYAKRVGKRPVAVS